MIRSTPELIGRFALRYARQRRFGMLVGIVVWTSFYIWDVQLYGHLSEFWQIQLVRLGIGTPLIGLLAGLSFLPSVRRDWHFSLLGSAAILVAWCCLLEMMSVIRVPYAFDEYVSGLMTVMLFHFTTFKHRWRPALGSALVLCVLFNIAVYLMWRGELSHESYARWFSANSHLLAIVALGTFLCYEVEQSFYLTELQRDEVLAQNLELRAAHEQAQSARDKAEVAYKERTAFLMQASHDLRQPMQSIEIYVDLLKGSPLPMVAVGTVEKLGHAVRSMDDLFRGLLDLNRLDAGAIQARLETCFLPALVEDVTGTCAPLATKKGLGLRVRCQAPAWAYTDPALVRRILRNLLVNAIAYTQRGGVLVTLRRRGDCACIQVFDTGDGIEPENMQEIFKPFVRLRPDGTHARRGLGLGLAIVRGMADKVGAVVSLRSRRGHGSAFGFTLPLLKQVAVASVPPVIGAPEPLTPAYSGALPGCIALVENDPEIPEAAAALMRAAGYQVVHASQGQALLNRLQASGMLPAVLVADVELDNGDDAWSVLQVIQTKLEIELPMVLMTGSVQPDYRLRARQAGQVILQKPFAPQDLLQAIRDTVNGAAVVRG